MRGVKTNNAAGRAQRPAVGRPVKLKELGGTAVFHFEILNVLNFRLYEALPSGWKGLPRLLH